MITFFNILYFGFFVLTLPLQATAFWRMSCRGRANLDGIARIDPLVEFGRISEHAHNIHGGKKFDFTTTSDKLKESECTSCTVMKDKSAYWTPTMYFVKPDGTAIPVKTKDGLLVYYLLFGDNIQAFPHGFGMLAGDKSLRSFDGEFPDKPKASWTGDDLKQSSLAQKALGFNCLNYQKSPEPTLWRHTMPPTKSYLDDNCTDGLRVELKFPSCWNGKDLDSPDHKSHVAYPNLVIDGDCPSGFESRIPSLLYETIYDTYAFKGEEGKFVFSNGDPTGCGYHGDFITGWDDVDFLQEAVDTCTNESGRVEDCPVFQNHLQSYDDMRKCQIELPDELKNDRCDEERQGICGNVVITTEEGVVPSSSDNQSDELELYPEDNKVEEYESDDDNEEIDLDVQAKGVVDVGSQANEEVQRDAPSADEPADAESIEKPAAPEQDDETADAESIEKPAAPEPDDEPAAPKPPIKENPVAPLSQDEAAAPVQIDEPAAPAPIDVQAAPSPLPTPPPTIPCPGTSRRYEEGGILYEVCEIEITTTTTKTVVIDPSHHLYRRHVHVHHRRNHG